jgi:hypothetical protein
VTARYAIAFVRTIDSDPWRLPGGCPGAVAGFGAGAVMCFANRRNVVAMTLTPEVPMAGETDGR